jgi:hypothetical protein
LEAVVDTDGEAGEGNSSGGEPEAQSESRHAVMKAPYMSYAGFKALVEKLIADGIPGRFDKSYFGNISGSLVAQTRGTLRHFDLIDDEQHPTDLLRQLIESDEQSRKALQKQMFLEKYPDALALSENATNGQLADVFRGRGLNGATVTKAINFYLGMAQDVDVALSPHFKKGRVVVVPSGSRKRRATKAPQKTGIAPVPMPPVTSKEVQRAKYVEMLMTIAAKSDGEMPSADLLDRIERALGYEEPDDTPASAPKDPP